MRKINNVNKKNQGRTGRMHGQFLTEFRSRLVSGEFQPGEKLPTRPQLIKKYSISGIALQQAVDRLEREGFLTAKPRLGTYVSQHPPHLCHYGLVFSRMPDGHNRWDYSRFWSALAEEAQKTTKKQSGKTIKPYVGVTGHADNEPTRQLIADVKARRLAGLILTDPYSLSSFLPNFTLPIVGYMRKPDISHIHAIELDQTLILQRCVDQFAAEGRSRVSLITSDSTNPLTVQAFEKMAREKNMETNQAWTHGVNLKNPRWACNIICAMMQTHATSRPDCIIITDDHLVEPATHGLLTLGTDIQRQTSIIGYANLGYETPLASPVRRIGFVPGELLSLAVRTIDQINQGNRAPRAIKVDPMFDFERNQETVPNEDDAHLVR